MSIMLQIAANPAATKQLDASSHFILRLAFCTSEENRRWLTARECDLFKHRYNCLSAAEKVCWCLPCILAQTCVAVQEHTDNHAAAGGLPQRV